MDTEVCCPSCWSWVVGLNQIEKGLPRHHRLHLKQEPLPFSLLLDGGELVIKEAELLTTHYLSPAITDPLSRERCWFQRLTN